MRRSTTLWAASGTRTRLSLARQREPAPGRRRGRFLALFGAGILVGVLATHTGLQTRPEVHLIVRARIIARQTRPLHDEEARR